MIEVQKPVPCVVIHAPEWFKDPGFLKMLNYNGEEPNKHGSRRAATWHVAGTPTDVDSDVFMTWEGEEGSEQDFLSEEIWNEITAAVRSSLPSYTTFCVVWIKNL
ncbi:MAG: hypothetical protein WC455_09250 [Dehalococcoidia bacterium]|jgi:hypothetical protein